MSSWLSPKFLEGQLPPTESLASPAMVDFYSTHLERALNGYSYNGHRITGDHYWMLNFWPIRLNLPDPNGGVKPIESINYPLWTQADDYLFKQLEEADQAGQIAMWFTGRGQGKSIKVTSIFGKGYVTNPIYRGVFSAAVAKHVDNTWKLFTESLTEMEKKHPFLKQRRILDSTEFIQAGYTEYTPQGPTKHERALVEKVLYDKDPGKTRGRRLNGQLFEEGGDWNCPATLKECIDASLGSWRIGKTVKVRAFIIGTGGSVRSADAKELFLNPETYSIYPVTHHDGRKTAIFIPTMQMCGGFYEETGIPDVAGAEKWLDEERAKKAGDPSSQKQFIQEYPKNWVECFERSGAQWFNRTLLAAQHTELTITRKVGQAKRGYLTRHEDYPKIRFVEDPEGPFHIWERPPADEAGRPVAMRHAYIGGLDSIDQSKIDSASPDGSKLALLIKKRQGPITQTGNMYVAAYVDRPNGPVEIAYDNVLKLLEWYDCQVNLEYTKISIVPFLRSKGAFGRLIKRPKIFLSDKQNEKYDNLLIGSPMDPWTKSYGINKIKSYVEQYAYLLHMPTLIEQLLDYEPERQTEFDWVVAMMLCEIADEELAEYLPQVVAAPEPWAKIGYYNDERGIRRHGILPGSTAAAEVAQLTQKRQHELRKGKVYFLEKDGTPVMAQPLHQMVREW
jgi:hypothetical protein